MNRWLMLFVAIGGALLLAACATLSQDQCETGDWRAIGFSDGAAGRPIAHLSRHVDACGEFGIALDRGLYDAGRAEGLRTYCRLDNAENLGRAGRGYTNVCGGELGAAFAQVHRAALDVYETRREISSLGSQISAVRRELSDPELSEGQVRALRDALRDLESDRRFAQSQQRLDEQRLALVRRNAQSRLAQAGISA